MIAAPEVAALASRIPAPHYTGRLANASHRYDSKTSLNKREAVSSISSDGLKPYSSSPPYIQALYRTALLTPDEERAIFRLLVKQKNAAQALRTAGADNGSADQQAKLMSLETAIVEIRNAIVEANLRLVVSVAKRFVGKGRPNLAELISEGNSVLIRAVELFDPEFGTRFSTYATTALQRALMTSLKSSYRQEQRYTTGTPDAFASLEDQSPPTDMTTQAQFICDANVLLEQLDDRERFIVKGRFAFAPGSKPQTFRELGEALGLSKERIRQVLVKALEKLRHAAEEKRISPPDYQNT